ncbi:MAG: hypothetical protein HYV63_09520 [Candidatus Schekmanbacteria bacterium]|nr:hypothetical protein [Candidatus Schekmanbacteria bacterium]
MMKAESKIPGIIALMLIGTGAYLAYMFVPVYMDHLKLNREVEEVVNWDRIHRVKPPTSQEATEAVLAKAEKIGLKLTEKNIKATVSPDQKLEINVGYQVDIDLLLYGKYVWKFQVHQKEKAFRQS